MESSSRSVIFDMAETTTTTGRLACSCCTMRAATRMRSAEPILVPPNFMTSRLVSSLMALVLPSVGDARAHHLQNGLGHFVLTELGGIQGDCVGRLRQGGVGARAVALIAFSHLCRKSAHRDFHALGTRFQQPPVDPLIERRDRKSVRVGKECRSRW